MCYWLATSDRVVVPPEAIYLPIVGQQLCEGNDLLVQVGRPRHGSVRIVHIKAQDDVEAGADAHSAHCSSELCHHIPLAPSPGGVGHAIVSGGSLPQRKAAHVPHCQADLRGPCQLGCERPLRGIGARVWRRKVLRWASGQVPLAASVCAHGVVHEQRELVLQRAAQLSLGGERNASCCIGGTQGSRGSQVSGSARQGSRGSQVSGGARQGSRGSKDSGCPQGACRGQEKGTDSMLHSEKGVRQVLQVGR